MQKVGSSARLELKTVSRHDPSLTDHSNKHLQSVLFSLGYDFSVLLEVLYWINVLTFDADILVVNARNHDLFVCPIPSWPLTWLTLHRFVRRCWRGHALMGNATPDVHRLPKGQPPLQTPSAPSPSQAKSLTIPRAGHHGRLRHLRPLSRLRKAIPPLSLPPPLTPAPLPNNCVRRHGRRRRLQLRPNLHPHICLPTNPNGLGRSNHRRRMRQQTCRLHRHRRRQHRDRSLHPDHSNSHGREAEDAAAAEIRVDMHVHYRICNRHHQYRPPHNTPPYAHQPRRIMGRRHTCSLDVRPLPLTPFPSHPSILHLPQPNQSLP